MLNNEKGLYTWLQTQFYAQPALPIPMTWQDSIPPVAPSHVSLQINKWHLQLSWTPVSDNTPIHYNVYRLDSTYGDQLLAIRTDCTHFEQTIVLPALRHSRYAVTAVDAYGNESQPTFAQL